MNCNNFSENILGLYRKRDEDPGVITAIEITDVVNFTTGTSGDCTATLSVSLTGSNINPGSVPTLDLTLDANGQITSLHPNFDTWILKEAKSDIQTGRVSVLTFVDINGDDMSFHWRPDAGWSYRTQCKNLTDAYEKNFTATDDGTNDSEHACL